MIRGFSILLILAAGTACQEAKSIPADPDVAFAEQDDSGELWGVSDLQRDIIESAVEGYRRRNGLPEDERPGIVHVGEFDDGFHYRVDSAGLSLLVVLDPESDAVLSISDAGSQADQ